MQKRTISFGLSLAIVLVLAFTWAEQRSIFGNSGDVAEVKTVTQTASALRPLPPIENSKRSLVSGMEEIKKSYQSFKESIYNVLVPFIANIEVYDKK